MAQQLFLRALWLMVIWSTIWIAMHLLTGCITFSPDEWSPREQRQMQKACRVACYPNGMGSYESINGKCTCN